MVGVEFAVAVFVNPIFDRLPGEAGLAARSDGGRGLGRGMPFWYSGSIVLGAVWGVLAWGGGAARPGGGRAGGGGGGAAGRGRRRVGHAARADQRPREDVERRRRPGRLARAGGTLGPVAPRPGRAARGRVRLRRGGSARQLSVPDTVPVRAATLISRVATPTLLLAVLYPVVGALAAGWAGVAWSLLGMVFTVAIPAAIVDVGVRQGRYTDHHLSRREQRAVPLGLSAASVLAGLAVLTLAGAPRAIVALQVAVLVTVLVVTALTLLWKVSLHVAVG